MSLLCIPIRETTIPGLKNKLKAAERQADLTEIWVDHLPVGTDPGEVIGAATKPVIVVNKHRSEGGRAEGPRSVRMPILKEYAKAGAAYVDTDIDTTRDTIFELRQGFRENTKLVLSYHDFIETPPFRNLVEKFEQGVAKKADIIKIATFAKRESDNHTVMQLLCLAKERRIPLIAICMGTRGKLSRIMGPAMGSYMTFVSLDKDGQSAPGQLTVEEHNLITLMLKS